MRRKPTIDEIIKSYKEVHKDTYNYDKVVYVNSRTKICITCKKHGDFMQSHDNHKKGHGCPECRSDIFRKRATPQTSVIRNFVGVHGDMYDYSKVEYINNKTKVCIICPEHGEFWQTPKSHLKGHGCPECGNIRTGEARTARAKHSRPDLSHIETPKGSKAVPLTKGKYAIVDDEDYERCMEHLWHYSGNDSAFSTSAGYMHRFIMNCPDDMEVDHIFHNRLDNRKSQLRVCTKLQNSFNIKPMAGCSSKYKGVSWDKRCKKWTAQIKAEGASRFLGRFATEEEAARAYDKAAKEIRGDFAYLNFPND